MVKGSGYGFVVTGASAAGQLVAYTSTGTGTAWLPTGPLGNAAAESVVGATVAPAGTIVAIGYTAASKTSQQPVFLEASTDGSVRPVSLAGIAGAAIPEMKVNSTAVAGGLQIAVGSANGYPAVWRKGAGGTWTLVSSLALVAADPRLRALTSVTHGPAGWLAVGAPGPVVLTSADGANWGVAGGNITQDLAGVSAVAATSGPAGYVIVGKLVAPGGGCVADVWWSANLTSWTRAHDMNDATGSSQVLAVAASAHGFVSVGSHDGQPAVWTTSNGRSWETIVLPLPDGASTAVAPAGRDQRRQRGRAGPGHDGHGPAVGSATGTAPGAVPFAELSADGGQTWQQVPFSSPGPDTAFTALTADAAGFTAAGLFGPPGQQDVALWTSANGVSWKPSQSSGLNGSEAWQIDTLAPSGSGGGRHRHHHHSAEPADRHLHPPRPLKEVPMCATDLDLDLPEIAEDEQASPGPASRPPASTPASPGAGPGVSDAQDEPSPASSQRQRRQRRASVHPVEDLAHQVHRGVRVQEREPGHRLALPRRRRYERHLVLSSWSAHAVYCAGSQPRRRNSTTPSDGSRISSRSGRARISSAVCRAS